MDSLKDYLKTQFNRVAHIADAEIDMHTTSYDKACAEHARINDILMQTVDMKIKLLLQENPYVYIATIWWGQSCKTEERSIWRNADAAIEAAKNLDACDYHIEYEPTRKGIYIKDFKNPKLLKEFAIRELSENLHGYNDYAEIYRYLHEQYDFLSKEVSSKWEIVLNTKEENYYIDTKNNTINLYANLLKKDYPNLPAEELKKMALKELNP